MVVWVKHAFGPSSRFLHIPHSEADFSFSLHDNRFRVLIHFPTDHFTLEKLPLPPPLLNPYIHTYTCIYNIYTCIRMCTYILKYIKYVYICIYIYIYTHTYTYIYIYTYIYVFDVLLHIHTHTNTYIKIHVHTPTRTSLRHHLKMCMYDSSVVTAAEALTGSVVDT